MQENNYINEITVLPVTCCASLSSNIYDHVLCYKA